MCTSARVGCVLSQIPAIKYPSDSEGIPSALLREEGDPQGASLYAPILDHEVLSFDVRTRTLLIERATFMREIRREKERERSFLPEEEEKEERKEKKEEKVEGKRRGETFSRH